MDENRSKKSFGELPTWGREEPSGPEARAEGASWSEREMSEAETLRPREGIRDDGRTDAPRRWLPGEEILGRYAVERELGQGGMGVVYGCLDKVGGVKVAVKGLPPELGHNSEEMEEVRENFQLVVGLRHPNIAGVRTLEKDGRGEYFLVMDVAEGEPLRRWMRRRAGIRGQEAGGRGEEERGKGMPLEEAVPILRQVAAALDYAHGKRVVHRDVKPGNVMIDGRTGEVKVLDFGLADQIRTSLSRASRAYRGTSGTGPYMAPEQWRGQPQDGKADQYALGVMAYEMLAGHLPFENGDSAVLKDAVLNEAVREIPGVDRRAMGALRRALAKRPEERWESCGAFVEALAGEAGGGGRQNARGRTLMGWVAALGLGVAVVAGMWMGERGRSGAGAGEDVVAEPAHPEDSPNQEAEGDEVGVGNAVAETARPEGSPYQEAEGNGVGNAVVEAARPEGSPHQQREEVVVEEGKAKAARPERAPHRELAIDLGNGVWLTMVHCPGVAADFWLGKTEVTQAQWLRVTGKSPSCFGGKPENPVENVSWNDCQAFVDALNALPAARNSGLTFRLPEEWEWEKACRAGAPEEQDYCKLEDGTQVTKATLSRVAWHGGAQDKDGPHPAGVKEANAWGFHDMHGNVWEWTQTGEGNSRVNRGGGFGDADGSCTARHRWVSPPDSAYGEVGLRIAATGRGATR